MAYREAYNFWCNQLKKDLTSATDSVCPRLIEDGLVLTLLRFSSLPYFVLHMLVFLPFMALVGSFVLLFIGRWSWNEYRVKGLWHVIVDVYLVAWTVILVWSFSVAFFAARDSADEIGHRDWSNSLLTVPGAIAALRLYEMFAFISSLHTKRKYKTFRRDRAVVNTLWHYAEAIVAFATLYTCVAYLYGDPFGKIEVCDQLPDCPLAMCKGGLLADNPITPIYFSTISISTVGYGDMAPQTAEGRVIVAAEIAFGLFLLVIVVQRVMSTEEHPPPDPNEVQ